MFLSGATLTLTLSHAARPGQKAITLYYDGDTPLRDPDGNRAPPFRELAVTNATPGGPAPSPLRASVMGRELRLVFDRALDETSPPPGDAFVVVNHTQGTGTATVSGKTVSVRLVKAVPAADRLKVNYTKPGEIPPTYSTYPEPGGEPLRGAAADNPEVVSFAFWIETVHDGVPPALLGRRGLPDAGQPGPDQGGCCRSTRALDTGSVPASGDFAVSVAGAAATISAVAVEGNAVALTLNAAAAAGSQVAVSYTPGTNPIQDKAGNLSTAFEQTVTASASGRPALQSATRQRKAPDADLRPPPRSGQRAGVGGVHAAPAAGPRRAGGRPRAIQLPPRRSRGGRQDGGAEPEALCHRLRRGGDTVHRDLREARRLAPPGPRRHGRGRVRVPGGDERSGAGVQASADVRTGAHATDRRVRRRARGA